MENNEDLFAKLNKLDQSDEKIQIEKSLLLKSALTGTNAEDIFKAQKYLKTIQQNNKVQEPKSLFLDPLMLSGTGYRQRAVNLSYNTLRLMARVPQIRAIIETRKEQIARFCTPQKDKYSTGFVIRPKQSNANSKSNELTNQQLKEIEELTNFIIHCGNPERIYTGDDFQTFSRKVLDDSLILDQCTAEIIFTNGGDIYEFRATDAATYRYSELKDETDEKYDDKRVNGFLPSHVQIYQERIISEFYPWELMFGIRNPKTDIYQNGYGRGELEDLIETVTSLLNAGQYNSNFFKVGSNPKGILKVSGDFNPSTLEEFKTQWQAQLAGTKNCIHPDTLIWTKEFGGLEIENVVRGEESVNITIWTGTKWEKASAFKTGQKSISITRVNCGVSIKTSPEHRFAIVNDEGEFDWKEQKDLKIGDVVLLNKGSYEAEIELPKYNGKEITEDFSELLGWLIGDGSIFYKEWDRIKRDNVGVGMLFFHHDKEQDLIVKYKNILESFDINVSEYVRELSSEQVERYKRKYKYVTVSPKSYSLRIYDKNFIKFLLNDLGFQTSTDGKVVPEKIFSLPERFRSAFLRGLFSADGNKEGICGARLTITPPLLRFQVRNLLLSIGIRTANCEKNRTKPSILTIRDKEIFHEKVGFIQPHKQPDREIPLSITHLPESVVIKYAKLAKEKNTLIKVFTERESLDLNNIIRGHDKCTLNRLKGILDKVNIEYPSFWNEYHFEKVILLTTTDEIIDMYDVEVYDDIHAFVADGIIVHNSHKLPIINAEKMDFVSTQQSNKDMEFSAYNDFLLKTACALYKIDPEEIGFPMGRGSEGKAPAFEGSNEHRLKYSRDRGLKPLLEVYQFWLNKWVLYPKTNSKYEIAFVGIDEFSAEQELDNDIKSLQNFETVNEVRKRRGLKPLEGYDMILNPVSSSMVMQQKQMDMMGVNGINNNQQEEENPIQKALEKDLEKLFS